MTANRFRHYEAASNAILGIAIAQLVLWLFSVPGSTAIALNLVLFATSYARSFALRILFGRISR
jgi:hypothetical protein